jgi:hypothetical protein
VKQFLQYPFMARDNLSAPWSAAPSPAVYRFLGLRFYCIGCRKLAVPVWLGATGTRI